MMQDYTKEKFQFHRRGGILYFISLFFLFLTIAIMGTIIGIFFSYSSKTSNYDIDSLSSSRRPSESTKIYASDGTLLANLYIQNRTIVPIQQIPDNLKLAFIAVEDTRFYEHKGIDIIGIARALYENITQKRITQGGSTITQQLARNIFLDHKRTVTRKIKEILIAFQMERKYSKDEILELYLNQIYFGQGAYGVEAAAQTYFGKTVSKINLAESSLLASLPKSPINYSPFVNFKLAKQRQEIVLSKMLELGFITESDYENAKKYKLQFAPQRKLEAQDYKAPYFTSYVIDQLIDYYDDATAVFRGGLRVYTTLNTRMQNIAEQVMESALKEARANKLNITQGALVAIEVKTGNILAMVGGSNFSKSQFNRAVQAKRQPGSAFKPFVYTAAIDSGFSPNSIVEDAPVEYGVGGKIWRPENYDKRYRGILTFRKALALSINIPAIKIAEQIGIDNVVEYARKMGLTSVHPYRDRNLALAIGGLTYGVSPLEIAGAFSVFANRGIKCKPQSILRIEHSQGAILRENRSEREEILNTRTADIMVDMLRDVIRYGTGTAANIGRDAAGKTGTTSDFRDCWFVGFTPDISCAVWFGNDNNSPTNRVVGGNLPARTWAKFMRKVLSDIPPVNFKIEYIVSRNIEENEQENKQEIVKVEICKISELLANPYCPEIISKEFISGQETKKICNIHYSEEKMALQKEDEIVEFEICKTSGLLANEYCNEVMLEELPRKDAPKKACDIHTQKKSQITEQP